MKANQDPFWAEQCFDPDSDAVNDAIWSESPRVQESIQPVSALRTLNAIGAQQGMIDPNPGSDVPTTCETVLPWVPDLIGKNWKAEESILIVGSAYAPFIKEYSNNKGMRLQDYLRCKNPNKFREHFVNQVVTAFRGYYGFVEQLGKSIKGENATFADFALTDLCKASFVRRGAGAPGFRTPYGGGLVKQKRTNKGGDGVVKCAPELYAQ